MVHFQASDVRRYYDENTKFFLHLGEGNQGTIRRAVWGPGVVSQADAMLYVEKLIYERIKGLSNIKGSTPPYVVDLGCGVCSSLCRLADEIDLRGTGITISKKQSLLAKARIDSAGLASKLNCLQGDFCQLPAELPQADLAFAIESFVHAPHAADFFSESARLIHPGGLLLVCDDFIASQQTEQTSQCRTWLNRFRNGWVASNVSSLQRACELAEAHGFVLREVVDLTSHLELGRPRDKLISGLMHLAGWWPWKGPYFSMLSGGHALQICLKNGWLKHQFVVWQRRPTSSD